MNWTGLFSDGSPYGKWKSLTCGRDRGFRFSACRYFRKFLSHHHGFYWKYATSGGATGRHNSGPREIKFSPNQPWSICFEKFPLSDLFVEHRSVQGFRSVPLGVPDVL